jgi:hypothetical protein
MLDAPFSRPILAFRLFGIPVQVEAAFVLVSFVLAGGRGGGAWFALWLRRGSGRRQSALVPVAFLRRSDSVVERGMGVARDRVRRDLREVSVDNGDVFAEVRERAPPGDVPLLGATSTPRLELGGAVPALAT